MQQVSVSFCRALECPKANPQASCQPELATESASDTTQHRDVPGGDVVLLPGGVPGAVAQQVQCALGDGVGLRAAVAGGAGDHP